MLVWGTISSPRVSPYEFQSFSRVLLMGPTLGLSHAQQICEELNGCLVSRESGISNTGLVLTTPLM